MTKEKIEKLKVVLGNNSNLVDSKQEHIIFTKFIIEKTKELENILFKDFEVTGKRSVLSLAVLYLLEDLKNKEKKDGK
jgi:hypothetical protein